MSLTLNHPQATHTVDFSGIRVAYLLVRSARRTVGLEVCSRGLTVRAPLRASIAGIEQVLQDKRRWVLSKLQQRPEPVREVAQPAWAHGSHLPFLGGQLQLKLHPLAPRGGELLAIGPSQWVLHLPVAPNASPAQVRAVLAAWWLRYARDHFAQRLRHFAPMLGVQWRQLRLSNARTRWGSASTEGRIMLNWRLMHFPPAVLDYVVIHELSHLRVMDHSPRFWAVVASICPDYAALRKQLRSTPVPTWTEALTENSGSQPA